jgi:hypothetical protein
MSCSKHFMGLRWERHAWERQVAHTASRTFREADIWGRVNPADHVTCHAQYVCRDCGAIRDGEECGCDSERAETCAVRMACLSGVGEHERGGPA